ncbi:MAG: NAD-glutamate dehydrogenase, partial [Pseudomonadota bacterium]
MERILDTIVASRVSSDVLASRAQIKLFLGQYFAHVPVEDMRGRSERIMARIALDHLAFAARRKPGEARIRIFNPTEQEHGYVSRFTVVEIVNDDMPFLVDSVSAAISRHELPVHITVHPVIPVARTRGGRVSAVHSSDSREGIKESFMRFAIERETEAERLAALEAELVRVLADVRLAVDDWPAMRQKMADARESLETGPTGVDEDLREESRALLDWMVDDRFTFLGYRQYRLTERGERVILKPMKGTGLGLLSGEEHRTGKDTELTSEMRRLTRSKDWLIITKANSRSTVHRNTYLDYVG